MAREELQDCQNVIMLQQDALKNKNQIHAHVLQAVRDQLAIDPARKFKLVANLPYNIATPLLSNLLSTDIVPVSMTVTIQRELAERIVAIPRTKDYSALSIWMQSLCDTEIVRIMPPDVFWPRPKIDSAIIHVVTNAQKRSKIPDLEYYHTFVRSLFFHRRKFLRSVLISAYKERLDKPAVDSILTKHGFGPTARAEELPVTTIQALCESFRQLDQQSQSKT
jgi:16S rRNA (adenine1518-N6/adenine1519-N6)-dimethyltransferase